MTNWCHLARTLLRELERSCRVPVDLVVGPVLTESKPMGAIVRLTEGQRSHLNLALKNKFGKPARVDGKPEWKMTGSDLVKLEVAGDGMSATFRAPPGSEGSARVQVTADADLGEGVEPIVSEADFVITAASANQIEIVPDAPEDDDTPTPGPTPTP